MRKQKKTTSTSLKGVGQWPVRALIPLLSKKENNREFVAKACSGADELLVLLVVDTGAMPGQFGFAASEIGQGNSIMQEIKQLAAMEKTPCNDIIEWGETETKITHFVQLQSISRVFLIKQDNQFFRKLVKELEKKTSAEIEIVSIGEA